MIADRNLLSGLLGLQNGFIDQVNLVVAFPTWMLDKLGQYEERPSRSGKWFETACK